MRKLGALLVAAIILFTPAAASAAQPASQALPQSDYYTRSIDRFDITYHVNANGSIDVRLDFLFNFNVEPGHGPFLTYPIRFPYDDNNDRFYRYENVQASSPSGAPAKVYADKGQYWLELRIGDENIGNVSGVQEYVVTYTLVGALNDTTERDIDPNSATNEPVWDELYWNIIGTGWEIPIDNLTFTVTGDTDPYETRCWAGTFGSTDSCTSNGLQNGAAVFTQDHLDSYSPMTVAIKFPAGSYNTKPIVRNKNDLIYALSLNAFTGTGFLVVLLASALILWRTIRGKAVDEQYAGLTPGLAPARGDEAHIVKRDYDAPVAVQFEPPPGLRPGQLGTLIDERADIRDVTATIVDLAVRGYMRIDPKEPNKKGKVTDYTFVKLRDADDALFPYEKKLLDAIFKIGDEVELSDLKTTFASSLASVQSDLYKNVVQLGWFRSNPQTARAGWGCLGVVILIVGVVLMWVIGAIGPWALIVAPLPILGIMFLFTIKNAPARKAEGTRVLAQTQGFERFLTTADANKLKFEEGHDVFSMYLPYAIAFGVAEKWAAVFQKMAAQGTYVPTPTWYGGAINDNFWTTNQDFGRTVNSFVSLADSAISAPTPGSSGGSGFSGGGFSGGGGGSSGGGGGGGGGGGW